MFLASSSMMTIADSTTVAVIYALSGVTSTASVVAGSVAISEAASEAFYLVVSSSWAVYLQLV